MGQPTPYGLSGKRVLVVGLGRSGVSVARFCAGRGARVTVNDRRDEIALGRVLTALPAGVEAHLGEHPTPLFERQDLIVLSPGVPPLPALEAARAAGVEVIGEIELAARHLQAELVGITGTNGKSTVTSWIGEMLRPGPRPIFVGGNLGAPLIHAVGTPAGGPEGACVVELSSFQLETCRTLRPRVALLLNLAEDHLDRYADLAAYTAAKARIFGAQRPRDWAVLNWDQPACRQIAAGLSSRVAGFGLVHPPAAGAFARGARLVVRLPERTDRSFDITGIRLVGRHNLENALAATLAAVLMRAPDDAIEEALRSFGGLPHRMEAVGEVNGVRFYNDSKATNVSAVAGSLSGFPGRYVWIGGGRHKGAPYGPLREVLAGGARALVLLGEAADRIAADLDGVAPILRVSSLGEAVARAAEIARPGEAVVLSPACASYDMFEDFEARGAAFTAAVQALEGATP
jgi:UDP-N-acetylmuramoylalanine--D-glutamate ligase